MAMFSLLERIDFTVKVSFDDDKVKVLEWEAGVGSKEDLFKMRASELDLRFTAAALPNQKNRSVTGRKERIKGE